MASSTAPVEVITFDADGTLWDFDATMRAALERSLAELRRRGPAAAAGVARSGIDGSAALGEHERDSASHAAAGARD